MSPGFKGVLQKASYAAQESNPRVTRTRCISCVGCVYPLRIDAQLLQAHWLVELVSMKWWFNLFTFQCLAVLGWFVLYFLGAVLHINGSCWT